MSCNRPLSGYRNARTGKVRVGVSRRYPELELPCGRCVGCRLDRARAWSIRISHEARLYPSNRFITLDYAPEHLKSWSLNYRDFVAFMRALRKRVEGVSQVADGRRPVRFFVAGEYGEKYQRPHFHSILFNMRFPDEVKYANGTSRSAVAEETWGRGNVVIGDVTARSASYVAGYTMGKVASKDLQDSLVNISTGEVTSRKPEFVQMSRSPGIGAWWYEKFGGDLFPHDSAVQEGQEYKVPRYYFEKYKKEAAPEDVLKIVEKRYEKSLLQPEEESSPARRLVKEEYQKLKQQFYHERNH